jgi:hypothetical protein
MTNFSIVKIELNKFHLFYIYIKMLNKTLQQKNKNTLNY